MKQKGAQRVCFAVLAALSLLFIFPLLVTLANSFMSETEIALNYTTKRSVFDLLEGTQEKFIDFQLIPRELTLSQYKEVLINQPSFLVLLLNSAKITLPVVVGNVLVSMLTAYGFTIWRWKYKEVVFAACVVVMLMPLQAVLVPNYIIADKLHIKDSYLAIILPGIFNPFGTFLFRQSMRQIPAAYFEAARLDGAGEFALFTRVVVPQVKSTVAALSMLIFIEYWNVVEQAIIFIKDYFKEPLSVYLSRIAEGRMGLVFAASCVYMLLPLWFLLMGQKDLEMGIELSGVK